MSKFVRTPEEIEAMLDTFRAPVPFGGVEMIAFSFRTTEEWVREILPPGLEPGDEPIVSVSMSKQAGPNPVGPYDGAGIEVACKHDGVPGGYSLNMIMNSDTAMLFGLGTFAEPKKMGELSITRQAGKVVGSVCRHGVELIHVEMDMPEEPNVFDVDGSGIAYHYKFSFAVDGSGLDYNPLLEEVVVNSKYAEGYAAEDGKFEVSLTKTADDVYGDIPILEILSVSYVPDAFNMITSAKYIAEVDKDEFLPYAFLKSDRYDLRQAAY